MGNNCSSYVKSDAIRLINPRSFFRTLELVQSNENGFQELPFKDFYITEKKTESLPGFIFPERFPQCCEGHQLVLKHAIDYFLRFPNCCDAHKKLNQASWFRKIDYCYVPIKILLTYIYTGHCIQASIDLPDWFKRITDYIEYTEYSFGNLPDGYGPPVGAHIYINFIKEFIEAIDIPKEKRKALLLYLDNSSAQDNCIEKIDINILIKSYKEWLSIFPFELSIFQHLKDICFKRTPIFIGPGETNIYTGVTKRSLMTYEDMQTFLISTTKMILKEINSLKLYQNKSLEDPGKIKLEITIAKREISLKKLEATYNDSSIKYSEIITEWLHDEKEFLDDIIQSVKNNVIQKPFIHHLIDGIVNLQADDERATCIKNLRNNGPDKELHFRDYFKTFFAGRFEGGTITAEEIKGNRYIDLKISYKEFGEKIIEFKGWWNSDKDIIVDQICGYLTDFHQEGYVFMINPNKQKSIDEDYKKLITTDTMKYLPDSWLAHTSNNTQLTYYESKHKLSIHTKTLYHVIFNAYF